MTAVVWNQVSADAAMALDEIFHRNDSSEQRGPETHRGRKCLYKVNSLDGDLALIGPRPAESRARGSSRRPTTILRKSRTQRRCRSRAFSFPVQPFPNCDQVFHESV
jgi:hypothetical protein